MKMFPRIALQAAALCLALGSYASAANESYLYIIHGIPGHDVAATLNPGLPVDILINGKSCLVRGLVFGNTSGPLSLAPGQYDVQVSLSNSLAPCTNPAVIDSQVSLASGQSISAVATLSAGVPVLTDFIDNFAPVAVGYAHFVFSQAADAGTLQATLTQLYVKNPRTFTVSADAGAEKSVVVPAGSYRVDITATGSDTVLTTETLTLASQDVALTYAVGQAANNSVGLINRTVRDVF